MKPGLLVGLALLLATSPDTSRAAAPLPAETATLPADAPQVVKVKGTGLTCTGGASHLHTALTNEAAIVKTIEQTGYQAQGAARRNQSHPHGR